MEKPNNIKIKLLQKRYEEKKWDIEAVYNQLNETQNAENKNQLERQINRLYEELENIDQEIKILKFDYNPDQDALKKELPPLLPYLVNRYQQELELKQALDSQISSRFLVCIIHGDELQSHYKFLDRIQDYFLPQLLDLDRNKTTIKRHKLECPSGFKKIKDLPDYLKMSLAKNVVNRASASLEEIQTIFNQYSSPVIVHTHLMTDDWEKQKIDILQELLKFCQDWYNQINITEKLIICIFIKYIQITWRWNFIYYFYKKYRYYRINKKIRQDIEKIRNLDFDILSVVVLSELDSITRSDVEKWAGSQDTEKFIGTENIQKLINYIGEMFDDWEKQKSSTKIPMNELADKLTEILKLFPVDKENQ